MRGNWRLWNIICMKTIHTLPLVFLFDDSISIRVEWNGKNCSFNRRNQTQKPTGMLCCSAKHCFPIGLSLGCALTTCWSVVGVMKAVVGLVVRSNLRLESIVVEYDTRNRGKRDEQKKKEKESGMIDLFRTRSDIATTVHRKLYRCKVQITLIHTRVLRPKYIL